MRGSAVAMPEEAARARVDEVERILVEHPAVAEAAAAGERPEELRAFVILERRREKSEELRLEILRFGRSRLGGPSTLLDVRLVDMLPRGRRGAVLRRLLAP